MDNDKAAASNLVDRTEITGSCQHKTDPNGRTQWKQWMGSITATMSMISAGTVYGWYTTCISRLTSPEAQVHFTTDEGGWLLSLTVVGSMIGPFIGAAMADSIGRKKTLLISVLYFIIGWVTVIFARSVTTYYVARLILGIGVGVSYTVNPMYVSEVADINIRGALGTLIATNVFTGSLFACVVGYWASIQVLTMILLSVPILFLATFIWFPESPYHLAAKGRYSEAMAAIKFFKGIQDEVEVREELDFILRNINENIDRQSFREKLSELRLPNNRRALFIVIGLIAAQQLSGSFTTTSYLEDLFKDAHIALDPDLATCIVLAVSLVSCTLSTYTVEKAGRRPLLFASTLGTTTTLGILATYILLETRTSIDISVVNWIPILDVILFQIAYQIGLGTLTNSLIGELFPTNVKGIAGATITVTDGILGSTISKLYQVIGDHLGIYVVYYFFTGSCLLAFFFVLAFVPETKNKTFAQIQIDLGDSELRCVKRRNKD
ncbi:facilitated trehalose transporter Tret1-like isoform X1 [Neodiprion pinetum]|uniref:facilitated trehalose transporter Tret1-like isoform X1 n=2 Tax=Neodiprion pinetum TaxID=441929 RepID=UPI001EE14C1E|nr:facilitated trehalose transporter Tret1-like isoform X1 [Neodiprion pinetum]